LIPIKKQLYNYVQWWTGNNLTIKHFIIEKSTDGITFKSIATKSPLDFNDQKTYFTYYDYEISQETIYYRIKIIYHDDNSSYSTIEPIMGDQPLITIFPNPIQDNTILIYSKENYDSQMEFELQDIQGKKIYCTILTETNTNKTLEAYQINLPYIAPGVYLAVVRSRNKSQCFKIMRE
jgi:hypothetical protein